MNILATINMYWPKQRLKLISWMDKILVVKKKAAEVKKYFHQWAPLWAYVRAGGRSNKEGFCFSLRFSGQEVATLEFQGKEVILKITEEQARPFKEFDPNVGCYPWRSKEATKFRKYFASNPTLKLRSQEHEIESRIIREMLSRSRLKFGGTLSGIQPVTLSVG